MLSGAVLASAAAGLSMAGPALAGPNGGTVVGGGATIQGQGSARCTINQSSQNAIINWSTFNIGKNETTTFNQPNSTSIALNRVIGGQGPSYLDGALTANGRVFVVNGDGIVFGPHSSINTAGFLATTNDIRNDDFMAGQVQIQHSGPAERLHRQSGVDHRRLGRLWPPWWRRACATRAPSRRRSAP